MLKDVNKSLWSPTSERLARLASYHPKSWVSVDVLKFTGLARLHEVTSILFVSIKTQGIHPTFDTSLSTTRTTLDNKIQLCNNNY